MRYLDAVTVKPAYVFTEYLLKEWNKNPLDTFFALETF